MPILHISLSKQNQQIDLSTDINAQMLTLKKCCISTISTGTSNNRYMKGGVIIDLPFLTGAEVVSSTNGEGIVVPFDEHKTEKYTEVRFDSDLQAEHIPRSFRVDCRNFENKLIKFDTTVSSTDVGEVATRIEQIDLFFEYKTSHKFF